jgi:decaprenylphospho-beta-D-ribofuranose 2-oxidase
MSGKRTVLTGWGRTSPSGCDVVAGDEVVSDRALSAAVRAAGGRGVIARGLGRSYGDPAQNAGGTVLDMTGRDRIHSIDVEAGVIDLDAGVSLDHLLRVVVPLGLWVPVLPGTRQVTIGGAIGCDIHGKNHHSTGTFGSHVLSIDLLCADGEIRTVGPEGPDAPLFWATVGGIGLTGVILRARLRLQHTESAYFVVDTDRTADLDETLAVFSDGSDDTYDYSMAWFDTMSTGRNLGRAVFSRGSLARVEQLPEARRATPLRFDAPRLLTLPDAFPSGLACRPAFAALGELWYRKAPNRGRDQIQNLTAFYHPLDLVGEWNRAYGPRGFLQYSFVVPFGTERDLRGIISCIATSGHISFLNVLKRFGPANPAPLSFPMAGWNVCVDFPVGEGLARFCDELDEWVLGVGGRLYVAKDSRTTPETFAAMYPRLDEWREIRHSVDPDGVFQSDMARRLLL